MHSPLRVKRSGMELMLMYVSPCSGARKLNSCSALFATEVMGLSSLCSQHVEATISALTGTAEAMAKLAGARLVRMQVIGTPYSAMRCVRIVNLPCHLNPSRAGTVERLVRFS